MCESECENLSTSFWGILVSLLAVDTDIHRYTAVRPEGRAGPKSQKSREHLNWRGEAALEVPGQSTGRVSAGRKVESSRAFSPKHRTEIKRRR